MIKTKFVFAVSLVAMLAVSSAWANAPGTGESVGVAHEVYGDPLEEGATGIAGVSYVNRVVNKAGASAEAAEAHAAAAGQSALDAASSAAEAASSAKKANDALTGKVSKAQGSTKANKAVITDASGNITTGTITSGMITDKTIVNADISDTAAISASKISGLATVASTGSYTDLIDKPTIGNATLTIQKNGTTVDTFTANATAAKTINITVPTKVSELTNDSSYATTSAVSAKVSKAQGSTNANKAVITDASGNITAGTITSGMITDKTIVNADISDTAAISASKISGLATVATSGSYADLSNKPTIGNATLTIQKNGTTVDTFTANATAAKTINITVPTTVAGLSDSDDYATVEALNSVKNELSNGNTQAVENLQGQIDDLATVASTGSYTDLIDKPTIGTSSLIIKNGATNTNIATFGANATAAVTATIPAATASVAGLAKIGVIPSGFETASEYAAIWVE